MRLTNALIAMLLIACSPRVYAVDTRPTTTQPAQRGTTLYVSKSGDNSDGTTWARAFTTIQAALQAVPDNRGGHRVIIRPDTYVEANLYPTYKGASGAYNAIVGDWDGKLGSGATGWVVIDSSCPDKVVRTDPKGKTGNPSFIVLDSGVPEKGLKSIDWWAPWRCDPDFSGAIWDRWTFKHLYVTGSETGIGWDMTNQAGTEFSVIVEDCVGIGRFAGACVIAHVGRPAEPIVFRRSYFCCLDWWGDAGAAYVRANHTSTPDFPDAIFDDCTLVSPDNALECGFPGFDRYTRVKFINSRLVVFNFSQPVGTPSSGIIHTPLNGEQLHVDLENCTLMGCRVFGAGKGEVSYSTKGNVRAYVQFQQPTPAGIERLGLWPADVFENVAPPKQPQGDVALVKEDRILAKLCEATPIVWKGRLVLMKCVRPPAEGPPTDHYLTLEDVESGRQLARFAPGYGLASAIVAGDAVHVFASRRGPDGSWNDVTHLVSSDLQNWEQNVAVQQDHEHLFNSSACATDNGFVMAYESDDAKYVPFTIKFARSGNLRDWTKVPDAVFGADRYAACPCIRYVGGRFYLMYLEQRTPRWFFETWMARSRDLKTWEMSPANPVLTPGPGEDVNTSDPDIVEFGGKTYLYYCISDQRTWAKIKRAVYPGTLEAFFQAAFP
jgi:hypothetical protein